MDLVQIVLELKRMRRLVAVGVILALIVALVTAYRVTLFPPGLHSKTPSYGTATTQFLLESPSSSLSDIRTDLNPVTQRAGLLASFMASTPLLQFIGRTAGIPPALIQASAPQITDMSSATGSAAPAVPQSSGPGGYSLILVAQPGLPIVSVFAQAPTAHTAARLANGAVQGLRQYLAINAQHVNPQYLVNLRQLGSATGQVVDKSVKKSMVVLAFLGALIGWCVLLLLISNLRRTWRRQTQRPDAPLNGYHHSPDHAAAARHTVSAHEIRLDG